MRIRLTCGASAAAVFAMAFMLPAIEGRAQQPADAQQDVRQKRLEWLQTRADEFEIHAGDSNGPRLKRGEKPILRWSNPTREFVNDGAMFLYFDGGRPRAVVNVWVRSREKSLTRGEFWRELISLSDEPLVCQRAGRTIWSPPQGGLVDQPIEGAEPPAESATRRLVQMRELARRFRASSYKDDGAANDLRLMPQPLFRYQDHAPGIVDGALFAFAEGNDAEALLLIEATTSDGGAGREWRYALSRMTSYRVAVRLDEEEVFVVEPYWKEPRKQAAPYSEARDGPFDLSENKSQTPESGNE
jgi:hypothetical protein